MPRIEPVPWEHLSEQKRANYEAGTKTGAYSGRRVPHQTLAYADREGPPPNDGDRHPNLPNNLLEGSVIEVVRLRSAQIGGCRPCAENRKTASATDEVVACLIDDSLRVATLNPRQRLAVEFVERLSEDHHGIDDDFYRRLAEHFTTAEIIALGQHCATTMGMHRFLHTLDFYSDREPVIKYDPRQRGVTWRELHGEPARNSVDA